VESPEQETRGAALLGSIIKGKSAVPELLGGVYEMWMLVTEL